MTFLKFFEDVLKVDEIGSDQEKWPVKDKTTHLLKSYVLCTI